VSLPTVRVPLLLLVLLASFAQVFLLACASPVRAFGEKDNSPVAPKAAEKTLQGAPTVSGSQVYLVQRGDSTLSLARKYLSQSSLMTVAELDAAIRSSNSLKSAFLKPGQQITIPTLETQPIVEKSRPTPKDSDVRAIYLTGTMAGSVRGLQLIRRWRDLGGNAVVFDIKDSDGSLSIPFNHPLVLKRRPAISNLPKYARFLHSMNMHSIARIALFRDENIAQNHSELAVHSRSTGKPWLENGKQVWTDPSNPQVQEYDLALAKYVASSGVDEIQFDYVRFPAEGDQKDAQFAFEKQNAAVVKISVDPYLGAIREIPSATSDASSKVKDAAAIQRKDVIANFLGKAYSELHPMGVLLSVDVFGVMAWQRSVDLAHTGQDIVLMARHCDVLSPMIYPSHFFGMDGYAAPGDAPEHFIGTSMARFQAVTADSGVVLRPWLQAFAWKTKTYSPDYILKQVVTSKQRGGIGFLLWNARNDYSKPFAAMPVMTAAADRYFGKTQDLGKSIPPAAPTGESKPTPHSPSKAPLPASLNPHSGE
jgi:hypothetical protein